MAARLSLICSGCKCEVRNMDTVVTHKFRCKKWQCYSCKACGQEFRGDEYKAHVECASHKETDSGECSIPKLGQSGKEIFERKVQFKKTLMAFVETSSLNPDLAPVWTRLKGIRYLRPNKRTFKDICRPLNLEDRLVEEAFGIISKVRQEFTESWIAKHKDISCAERNCFKEKSSLFMQALRTFVETSSLNPDLTPVWTHIMGLSYIRNKFKIFKRLCAPLKLEHRLVEEAWGIISKVRLEFEKNWYAKERAKRRKVRNRGSEMGRGVSDGDKNFGTCDKVDPSGETPMDVVVPPQTTEEKLAP